MSMVLEKTLVIKNSAENCKKCSNCPRSKMMELGYSTLQKIKIKMDYSDLWTVSLIDEFDSPSKIFAVRKDEMEGIFSLSECKIDLI